MATPTVPDAYTFGQVQGLNSASGQLMADVNAATTRYAGREFDTLAPAFQSFAANTISI